jgi:hypothetical protein
MEYASSCRETPDGMRVREDAERLQRICLCVSRDTGRHAREGGCRKARMHRVRLRIMMSRDIGRHARESVCIAFSCRETTVGMRERVGAERMQRVCLELPSAVARHQTACERGQIKSERVGYAFGCRETPGDMRERADAGRMHRVCLNISRIWNGAKQMGGQRMPQFDLSGSVANFFCQNLTPPLNPKP